MVTLPKRPGIPLFAPLLVTFAACMCGCERATTQPDAGEDIPFVVPAFGSVSPSPTGSGVLTIRFPNPPEGAEVDVQISSDPSKRWRPERLPVRLVVPFDQTISVSASNRDYYPFRRSYRLSSQYPSDEVTIALVEDRPYFGFRESEIPRDAGIVLVEPSCEGRPAGIVFSFGEVPSGTGDTGSLLVDERGEVWDRQQWRGTWISEHVASVDSYVFREMLALRDEAERSAEVVEIPRSGCKDCRGTAMIWIRGTNGGYVKIASGGDQPFRRASSAAGAIIVWMAAVQREVVMSR